MIIKNFKQLATTKTRRDALKILDAGIQAILTKKAITDNITLKANKLTIQGKSWNLKEYQNIYVVGAGKAAADMAESIEKILGKKITAGVVIDTQGRNLNRIKVRKGTHPIPSEKNIRAAQEILRLVEKAGTKDLIIVLISGGGSALLSAPRISLNQLIKLNKKLLASGATIQEINTVRKHISHVKGGQLAKLADKTELITLIASDVIGNDLNVIASGPTVRDPTTRAAAEKIRKKYKLGQLKFVETPKSKFKNVTNLLLVTNERATQAMKKQAQKLGYQAKIMTTTLKGEAQVVGKKLAKIAQKRKAIIAAGETTVIVKGKGKGGRNQEVALSASRVIQQGVLASCSTDGVDFITQAGGGIVDPTTRTQAHKKNLNLEKSLKQNDSYNILTKTNSIIKTGKTGANVGDLLLVLGEK